MLTFQKLGFGFLCAHGDPPPFGQRPNIPNFFCFLPLYSGDDGDDRWYWVLYLGKLWKPRKRGSRRFWFAPRPHLATCKGIIIIKALSPCLDKIIIIKKTFLGRLPFYAFSICLLTLVPYMWRTGRKNQTYIPQRSPPPTQQKKDARDYVARF